jgi:hypothetical protein
MDWKHVSVVSCLDFPSVVGLFALCSLSAVRRFARKSANTNGNFMICNKGTCTGERNRILWLLRLQFSIIFGLRLILFGLALFGLLGFGLVVPFHNRQQQRVQTILHGAQIAL